ncbi:MAG TPA: thymidylate synthase [Candidatus Hydrogenedentes bacterium]|nr:thymidylate synthase [Candidatus Hydrogenedentota bacterium]HOS02082.1 thymidylate synthase [Candidatus Hydrogenedentota bacterium]
MSGVAAEAGRIPTLHVVGDSIPQAYFRAIKAVWENGLAIRTEYDRKDASGNYIDPPSRDARVLIEVKDPFAQPRFPPISFCEIGTYIAEIMGVKDYRVVPFDKLKEAVHGELSAQEWPYTYHQRLFAHPDADGSVVDQIAVAIDRVVRTPYTRRAVATTSVPNIDPFLTEDIPCLREVQLRCPEDADGNLVLNMNTLWRSRDLYKAWGDNLIAITFLQGVLAKRIAEQSGRTTRVGSYADYSCSLHIYGQDFGAVGGDTERGLQSFFDTFDEETFIARSLSSEIALDMLVLPQLRDLLSDRQIEQWKFPDASIKLIASLINDLESGVYSA